ncbi:MAG: DUF1802 family protein [Egibacteraceae bacterium]
MSTVRVAQTLALKEWAAVTHALLDGRQTVLLRKGGIHERAFSVGDAGRFVVFPTVAHSHAERVRPEHTDLLGRGAADVDEVDGTFVVRCGLTLVDAIPVHRPEHLEAIADLHIWTAASVQADRLDFRPRHLLQALVVRAVALPEAQRLPRDEAYGGCRSWIDLPVAWEPGAGTPVLDEQRLVADARRVRDALGPELGGA